MQVVVGGDPGCLGERKYLAQPPVFFAAGFACRHKLRDKGRIIDMQFVGRDAHNGPVSGVHVFNAEDILAVADGIMVKLGPEGHCREPWAGELGQWMERQAVDAEHEDIAGVARGSRRPWPRYNNLDKWQHPLGRLLRSAKANPTTTNTASPQNPRRGAVLIQHTQLASHKRWVTSASVEPCGSHALTADRAAPE